MTCSFTPLREFQMRALPCESPVATNIASTSTEADGGGGGGGNNSTTTVTSSTDYPFWDTLVDTIRNLVSGSGTFDELDPEETVIANPANGVLMVRATGAQHEEVQRYLDEVRASSRRQVLIEATIVEVELSDNYQAGIDWTAFAQDATWEIGQQLFITLSTVKSHTNSIFGKLNVKSRTQAVAQARELGLL